MTKKKLCFGKVIVAFGLFLGFFWPSEGLRPSSGQKNPKNGPQAKMTLPQHKFFFVLPHDDIVVHFSMTHYIDFCLNVGLGGSFKYPCCIIKMTILVVTIDPGGPGDNFLNWPTLVIYRLFYCLDFVNFIKKNICIFKLSITKSRAIKS